MSLSRSKISVQISLPREVDIVLSDIVKQAKQEGMKCSKSIIIESALMCYFAYCNKSVQKKSEENSKEEN